MLGVAAVQVLINLPIRFLLPQIPGGLTWIQAEPTAYNASSAIGYIRCCHFNSGTPTTRKIRQLQEKYTEFPQRALLCTPS